MVFVFIVLGHVNVRSFRKKKFHLKAQQRLSIEPYQWTAGSTRHLRERSCFCRSFQCADGIDEVRPKKKSLASIISQSRRSSIFQSVTTSRQPKVLTIRRNPETGERTMDRLRWGLIPTWANDEKIAYKTINVRVETVGTAPSYRQAFKKHRCLIPADGFYEWRRLGKTRQPYSIQRKDGSLFAFAGLWEAWRAPGSEQWLRTCTIITCEPNEFCATIHNRMPVILP